MRLALEGERPAGEGRVSAFCEALSVTIFMIVLTLLAPKFGAFREDGAPARDEAAPRP